MEGDAGLIEIIGKLLVITATVEELEHPLRSVPETVYVIDEPGFEVGLEQLVQLNAVFGDQE